MGGSDPVRNLLREVALAAGMIAIIVIAMWAHTGLMPPLVVVESNSMQHDKSGEIGTIDAGDLVLVHSPEKRDIVTFAEATDEDSIHYGHETLGMEGDVVIFKRNGQDDETPIIHRAIFEIVVERTTPHDGEGHCEDGVLWADECVLSWSVPGTDQVDVYSITLIFDGVDAGAYPCTGIAAMHGDVWFKVDEFQPRNPGFITLGDNNHCSDDQGASPYSSQVMRPVADEWVIGVAGAEIPWLGTVKLLVSGGDSPGASQVPGSSFLYLLFFVGVVLAAPVVLEPMINRILGRSPEMEQAKKEDVLSSYHNEEE